MTHLTACYLGSKLCLEKSFVLINQLLFYEISKVDNISFAFIITLRASYDQMLDHHAMQRHET